VTVKNQIENFLLFGEVGMLQAQDFLAYHLGAYAYFQLPENHRVRPQLRQHYLVASVRHERIKHLVLSLVSAWSAAGIEVVLYKGFVLAELVYPKAPARFYGDVDMLIESAQVPEALKIAALMGWKIEYEPTDFLQNVAHEAILKSEDGIAAIELHQCCLQTENPIAKKITRFVLKNAIVQQVDGISIRTPETLDALLVMYLNRAWGDSFARKPHDILDVRYLTQKGSLEFKDLVERAKLYGVWGVLRVAMQTCNPWKQALSIGQLNKYELFLAHLQTIFIWGAFDLEKFVRRIKTSPTIAYDVGKGVLLLFKIRKLQRQNTDLNTLLQLLDQLTYVGQLKRKSLNRLDRGVRWALRLTNQHVNACVPRSLALFHALRKEGLEVSFVSGVRRNGSKLEGHAWLELNGKPIPGLGDENAPNIFKENFRYPKP
jgi:hypothetical protein